MILGPGLDTQVILGPGLDTQVILGPGLDTGDLWAWPGYR